MPVYTVLYAEDVPHYGTAEIEADNDIEAAAKAKLYDYGDVDLEADPNWSAVSKRIVHVETSTRTAILEDFPLDEYRLTRTDQIASNSRDEVALDAIREAIAEIEYCHGDMLTGEGRAHPRGSGWARVYDKLRAALRTGSQP